MKNLSHRISIYLLALCTLLPSCNQSTTADTIIYGGKIYTVNATNEIVEAVAIEKGKNYFCRNIYRSRKNLRQNSQNL